MQINRHGSFYIRNGWPTKIIDVLTQEKQIFSPNNELNAVDLIGVGRVMIKSMRYWATALGIAKEEKKQHGVSHELTELGNIIKIYDLYCTDIATLWLLHRNLSRNIENATAWYWAFNIYDANHFTKADFSSDFYAYLQIKGLAYNKKSIEKEFDCFKNTYVSDQTFSINNIMEEDTVPFFAPLKLIEYHGNGVFEKRKISSKDIPAQILLYCILNDNKDHLKSNTQINIDHLLEDCDQVGKYMNMSYSVLIELLQHLENDRYLKLINNFGNRYIQIGEISVNDLLIDYYRSHGGKL